MASARTPTEAARILQQHPPIAGLRKAGPRPASPTALPRDVHDRLVKALADLLLADLLRYPPGV